MLHAGLSAWGREMANNCCKESSTRVSEWVSCAVAAAEKNWYSDDDDDSEHQTATDNDVNNDAQTPPAITVSVCQSALTAEFVFMY